MANEDKTDNGKGLTETVTDEVKAVALEVYNDGAAPTVQAVGRTLGGVVRLLTFLPDMLTAGADRLRERMEHKLKDVPPERLLAPPETIAAPAMLQYALLGTGDDTEVLREMFESLVAASMDADADGAAHPAFVSIIAQLTSDEARMLCNIEYWTFPIIEAQHALPSGHYLSDGFICDWGAEFRHQDQYLANLERLGIIYIDWDLRLADELYEPLKTRMLAVKTPMNGRFLHPGRGLVAFTAFGRRFIDTCIPAEDVPAPEPEAAY